MCHTQHTSHSHLSQEERAVIEVLDRNGATLRAIATALTRHYSSISRELRRNRGTGGYSAQQAQRRCMQRRVEAKRTARLIENNPRLQALIEEKLQGTHPRGDWSPRVIAHLTSNVSHQTIYAWIRRSRPDLRHILPRCGKYRRRYGSRKNPAQGWTTHIRSIETRPVAADDRTELGHFEGDTVLLSRSRALLTLVDRKSKFLIASLVSGRIGMVYDVHLAIVAAFNALPVHLRRTLTPDRGGEFAYWDLTERDVASLTIYFAHAHSPWERGTNEHTNGLLRRYFSKREKHDTVTAAQVAHVVWMINHRPRKSLNWDTPCKVFGGCCISS